MISKLTLQERSKINDMLQSEDDATVALGALLVTDNYTDPTLRIFLAGARYTKAVNEAQCIVLIKDKEDQLMWGK